MPSASPQLLVIADDLTGSNDAGVQFARQGVRALVLSDWRAGNLPAGYSVVVINTESRHIPAPDAADRVRRVVTVGMAAGVGRFYKKTDSTLRGNIGAELQALLQATGAPFIPFIPALPDLGRTTRDGIHYVHGRRISETAFSHDPLNPVHHDSVAQVLAPQVTIPITSAKALNASPEGIVILDCESNSDLAVIARDLAEAGHLRVLAGSVALAGYLPPFLNLDLEAPDRPRPELPMLFVNGSVNERALDQIAEGAKHYSKVQLTLRQLLGGHADITIPRGGGNVLLYSVAKRDDLKQFHAYADAHGIHEKQLHLRVAERTGQIVHEILAANVFQTLVVFGGDTLTAIARANHWKGFISLDEAAPGLSVSKPIDSDLTLISKSGGFGDVDIVNTIVHYIEKSGQDIPDLTVPASAAHDSETLQGDRKAHLRY